MDIAIDNPTFNLFSKAYTFKTVLSRWPDSFNNILIQQTINGNLIIFSINRYSPYGIWY